MGFSVMARAIAERRGEAKALARGAPTRFVRELAMDAMHRTLAALLALARANEPAGILPVNQTVDGFIAETAGTAHDKIAALQGLEDAYTREAPPTELGCYARLVLGQRRRLLTLEPGTS
jgi:hypothetical protein